MANQSAARFEFIGHALAGDGPFRPVVTTDGNGRAINVGTSYLVKYPRESQEKFARRCELAFYSSPLSQACSRFVGYLSTRPAVRASMAAASASCTVPAREVVASSATHAEPRKR